MSHALPESEPLRTRPAPVDATAQSVGSFAVRPLAYLGPAVLGFVLWSVVCMSALEIELASGARAPLVLLHLQPLLVLLVGLLLRNAVLLLAGFPLALMFPVFALEPLDLLPLNTLGGALTLAGALVLFLVGTARLAPHRRDAAPVMIGERLLAGVDPQYRPVARTLWPRLVLMAALLVVPLLAIYQDAGQVALAEHFGARAREAVLLVHTVHLFVAVLAAYLFFLSPAINAGYEKHELREKLAAYRKRERTSRAWRAIALYLVVGAAIVALWVLVRLR